MKGHREFPVVRVCSPSARMLRRGPTHLRDCRLLLCERHLPALQPLLRCLDLEESHLELWGGQPEATPLGATRLAARTPACPPPRVCREVRRQKPIQHPVRVHPATLCVCVEGAEGCELRLGGECVGPLHLPPCVR